MQRAALGIGLGIAGYCPGPAMIVGMITHRIFSGYWLGQRHSYPIDPILL